MSHLQWPKQILIADQQAIFVEGLNTILRNANLTTSITVVKDKATCVQFLLSHQTHLILIDASLPDLTLHHLFELLKDQPHTVPVIAMGALSDAQVLLNCMTFPISGYVLKTCSTKELLDAITQVMNGQKYYCSKTTMLLQQLVASKQYHPHRKLDKVELNEKEKSILELICAEYTSKEIADQLNMSVRTVEAYRKSMQEKTGSRNSAGLILYAIKHGIVD